MSLRHFNHALRVEMAQSDHVKLLVVLFACQVSKMQNR
jgi:hypothetical protein